MVKYQDYPLVYFPIKISLFSIVEGEISPEILEKFKNIISETKEKLKEEIKSLEKKLTSEIKSGLQKKN